MQESILKKEILVNKAFCQLLAVLAFVVLITLGAFVRVPLPFTPVPITLQTMFVLLSGALLGSNLGLITQVLYVVLGISGLSVFTGASNSGLYLAGPTGGYIFGFVIAALLVGRLLQGKRHTFFSVCVALCAGDAVILGCGVIWLKALFGLTFAKALLIGAFPFLIGDALKITIAAALTLRIKPRLREIL